MVDAGLVAAPLTLLPAMGMLFLLLRRYEGVFEDRRLFFALVVGLFAGLVLAFLENVLFRFETLDRLGVRPLTSALWFVIGYALLESAAKVVVLGAKAFRSRPDTVYTGCAYGLGMGAILALQSLALAIKKTGLDTSGFAWWPWTLLILAAFGIVLTHTAAGAFVARRTLEGRLWRALLAGMLVTAPALGASWFWLRGIELGSIAVEPAVFLLAYGTGVLLFARRQVLEPAMPAEAKDRLRRSRRRALRQESQR